MNWLPESAARKTAAPSCATVGSKRASEVGRKIAMKGCLRLELSAETLLRLLASEELCAADLRCLDCETKHCLWRLLLMSCAKTINTGTACNGCCAECGRAKRGQPEEGTDVSVLIRAKTLPSASGRDPATRQSLIGKS